MSLDCGMEIYICYEAFFRAIMAEQYDYILTGELNVMIYTITFNPAIDYVMHTGEIKIGMVNRSGKEEIYFGGSCKRTRFNGG